MDSIILVQSEVSSYQRPRLWPLWMMMKKQVTIWMTHQNVRMAATAFACRSVSPTFSPRDFAHILHNLPKEIFKAHNLLLSPPHSI